MRGFRIFAAMMLALAVAGCMLPHYHQPAGFSGTYFRSLYGPAQAPLVEPPLPHPAVPPHNLDADLPAAPHR